MTLCWSASSLILALVEFLEDETRQLILEYLFDFQAQWRCLRTLFKVLIKRYSQETANKPVVWRNVRQAEWSYKATSQRVIQGEIVHLRHNKFNQLINQGQKINNLI